MKNRVVFDTNVLLSAVGWRGNPARCVELVTSGRIVGLTCIEILDELAEKLVTKLCVPEGKVSEVLGSFITSFELVEIAGMLAGAQPDPKDDMILECALTGRASYVVTGDKKHLLSLREFRGVKIVTATDLLHVCSSATA